MQKGRQPIHVLAGKLICRSRPRVIFRQNADQLQNQELFQHQQLPTQAVINCSTDVYEWYMFHLIYLLFCLIKIYLYIHPFLHSGMYPHPNTFISSKFHVSALFSCCNHSQQHQQIMLDVTNLIKLISCLASAIARFKES